MNNIDILVLIYILSILACSLILGYQVFGEFLSNGSFLDWNQIFLKATLIFHIQFIYFPALMSLIGI